MPIGQIMKAISGFYFVRTCEDKEFQCRARGIFKFEREKITPLVGDFVTFEVIEVDKGLVTHVWSRKTELVRPSIANVNQAVVVCSLTQPAFQQQSLDRVLIHAEQQQLSSIICLTKIDLLKNEKGIDKIRAIYRSTGYPIIATSIRAGEGIEKLKGLLTDKVTVFAGKSGVGKSSLLNEIVSKDLAIGAVNRKWLGKHTTRQVELIPLPMGGQVADTPGFSQLTFSGIGFLELKDYYPDFRKFSIHCAYRNCVHMNEQDCGIKKAVHIGELDITRYDHYLHFLKEIQEMDKRRY